LTESAHLHLFEAADGAVEPSRLHVIDDQRWSDALAPFAAAPMPETGPSPADTFMLIFTSGTTGAPKAVRMGHARLAAYGGKLAEMFGLTPHDVCYSVMPLFQPTPPSRASRTCWPRAQRESCAAVSRRRAFCPMSAATASP